MTTITAHPVDCDGCRRGLLLRNGSHYTIGKHGPVIYMRCIAELRAEAALLASSYTTNTTTGGKTQ